MLKNQHFHILLALSDGQLHGQAIMEAVLERTEGGLTLWPATLYGSLKHLTEEALIREADVQKEGDDGDRRRFYQITPAGTRALQDELARMKRYLDYAADSGIWK